ncbi:MAG TPA: putative baseplate assembly protein [Candidatus Saccharimonadales bacterium]|nr:putative baseplate assembly protein [Candidatus Saccharimonadales bacterium]
MTLPVPNLDDRRFQDLVDEAKRMVQQRCPEWTDHNVSDPGITLIETFAWMTDQLVYRLNRVPDRLYVKFLELIDVRLFPPTPARAALTFWLAAPAESAQRVAVNTKAATIRTETDKAIVFSTVEDLEMVPCSLASIATQAAGAKERVDRTEELRRGAKFAAFSTVPKPEDTLVIGLSDAVPRCAIRLRMHCTIEGVGVDPTNPPLAWEAWDGEVWHECDVDDDATGGLNRDGDVVIHIGREHVAAVLDGVRGGWIRARVTATIEGQPTYTASPQIHSVEAATVGGTVDGVNAEIVTEEVLGTSDGTAGQRFPVRRAPVLAGAGEPVLESSTDEGWTPWTEVQDFAAAGPDDAVFVLDSAAGEVVLGPAVRQPEGSIRVYGRVPDKGEELRLRSYATGGGRGGNVSRGAISVLKSSIPYVARVENRQAARGGVDGEDLENAKQRGPILLRTRARAVTAEDFEQLSREAAPEVGRVRCLSAGEGLEAGSVRILVVPSAPEDRGRLRFEQLIPSEETLQAIASRLEGARLVGTRVLVEPPLYQGVTVVARLRSRPRASPARVEATALDALFQHLNPISGGPDGHGWPFGRPVQAGEIFSILQSVRDVELVEDVRIFGADPTTGARGQATQRLEVAANSIVFSYEHQVRVEPA